MRRRGWRIRRRRHTQGQATMVETDWAWALAREETRGDVVGFWHTHAPGVGAKPSPRDTQTMRAWCLAFGKPLIGVITVGQDSTVYVYEGDTKDARQANLSHGEGRGEFIVW